MILLWIIFVRTCKRNNVNLSNWIVFPFKFWYFCAVGFYFVVPTVHSSATCYFPSGRNMWFVALYRKVDCWISNYIWSTVISAVELVLLCIACWCVYYKKCLLNYYSIIFVVLVGGLGKFPKNEAKMTVAILSLRWMNCSDG